MAIKKVVVENEIPNVYNNIIDIVNKYSEDVKNVPVIKEENMAKIRAVWHKFFGNVGNKVLGAVMNDKDDEDVKQMFDVLNKKAPEKAVEVMNELVEKLTNSKKIDKNIALKSVSVACETVGKRQIGPMQETANAFYEKKDMENFVSQTTKGREQQTA